VPAAPGRAARIDYQYEYELKGTCNLFMMCEPLRGWRHVRVTERRTRRDWAECIKELADVHYPKAAKIRLVMDNLNTHSGGSLYEAFPPAEARRLLDRLEIHPTPKHGSWLDMAEIELRIVNRQCLDRRIDDAAVVRREVGTLEADRNKRGCRIHWAFTLAAARLKLKNSTRQSKVDGTLGRVVEWTKATRFHVVTQILPASAWPNYCGAICVVVSFQNDCPFVDVESIEARESLSLVRKRRA
jgi:hypothetical protein